MYLPKLLGKSWNRLGFILNGYNRTLPDLWRELHPLGKDYTYYFHPHHSHSRIDHMFMLRKHLPLVVSTSILASPWSDHDPVLVVCCSMLDKPQHSPWVMNDSLLSLKEVQADILKASMEYFRINAGSVSSPVTLWEAYKAVPRGHIIQFGKREHLLKQDLEACLEVLSTAFKQAPTPTNHKLLD